MPVLRGGEGQRGKGQKGGGEGQRGERVGYLLKTGEAAC